MKLVYKIMTAAVVSAGLFFMGGCSKAEQEKQLTVWCWDPQFNIYAMNTAAEIYQREHPDVKVNVVETPWADLQQKLITSLSANDTKSLPDIILCQDTAMQKNIST